MRRSSMQLTAQYSDHTLLISRVMNIYSEEKLTMEGENHNEDENIDKFFVMVKRLRDARKIHKNGLRGVKDASCVLKKAKVQKAAWVPSFQWEDFVEPSSVKEEEKKEEGIEEREEKKEEEEGGNGLDLNLTL